MATIKGTRVPVLLCKYDKEDPAKMTAGEFTFGRPGSVKDGQLTPEMASSDMGWRLVGWAEISIELLDRDSILLYQVEALRKQRKRVLAEAQAKATSIEREIQTLLAITCEVKA